MILVVASLQVGPLRTGSQFEHLQLWCLLRCPHALAAVRSTRIVLAYLMSCVVHHALDRSSTYSHEYDMEGVYKAMPDKLHLRAMQILRCEMHVAIKPRNGLGSRCQARHCLGSPEDGARYRSSDLQTDWKTPSRILQVADH